MLDCMIKGIKFATIPVSNQDRAARFLHKRKFRVVGFKTDQTLRRAKAALD